MARLRALAADLGRWRSTRGGAAAPTRGARPRPRSAQRRGARGARSPPWAPPPPAGAPRPPRRVRWRAPIVRAVGAGPWARYATAPTRAQRRWRSPCGSWTRRRRTRPRLALRRRAWPAVGGVGRVAKARGRRGGSRAAAARGDLVGLRRGWAGWPAAVDAAPGARALRGNAAGVRRRRMRGARGSRRERARATARRRRRLEPPPAASPPRRRAGARRRPGGRFANARRGAAAAASTARRLLAVAAHLGRRRRRAAAGARPPRAAAPSLRRRWCVGCGSPFARGRDGCARRSCRAYRRRLARRPRPTRRRLARAFALLRARGDCMDRAAGAAAAR